MAKYVVTHGSYKTDSGRFEVGDEVELSPKEVAHVDQTGEKFMPAEAFGVLQKAKADEARAKGMKAAPEKAPEPPPAKQPEKGGR